MAFNTEDDIKAKLKFLGKEYSDWELEDILDEAHRRLDASVGRFVEEQLSPTREDTNDEVQQTFRLAFSEIDEVLVVELDDAEVDSADYTVGSPSNNVDEGSIKFTDSFRDDELDNQVFRLTVVYVPTIYKDLELAYAMEEILNLLSIQTQDSELEAKLDMYRKRVDRREKEVKNLSAHLGDPSRGNRIVANSRRRDQWRV